MAENSELSPRQLTAIASLLQHGTVTAAAKDADVPERTFYNWLALPEFAAELKRRQSELVDGAYRRLQAALTAAVDTIAAIMNDTANPPSVRLRAAESILANSIKLAEIRDLAQRVAELEALAPAQVANGYHGVVDYRLTLPALAPTHDTGDTETQD